MQIPEGLSPGMVIGSGGSNVKQLTSITRCCVKVIPEEKRVWGNFFTLNPHWLCSAPGIDCHG